MTKEDLKQEIIAAFKRVELGNGVGLWQGQGLDDYAPQEKILEYRRKDEKVDWQNIPSDDLVACQSSLSFFDAEGMRFHLPAFMIHSLDGGEDIEFHLTHNIQSEYFKEKFSLLNAQQKKAVHNYLLYLLEAIPGYDHRDNRKVTLRAVEHYWRLS